MKVLLVAALVATVALAGCSKDGGGGTVDPTLHDPGQLEKGKGAIAGLLLDDRYRPVAGGKILVQETAQTTTSNSDGEFYFVDLEPGTYRLRAEVPDHEALPLTVHVKEGEYAEEKMIANRLIDPGTTIITQEYSVFIPCQYDAVVDGRILPCSLDLADDDYSPDFMSDFSSLGNVTYVVTEMKANQDSRYEVQVRNPDTDPFQRYAVAQFEGDYVKIVMRVGATNEEHQNLNTYGANHQFDNDHRFQTIVFADSAGREELEDLGVLPPGLWCCGVGFHAGIKATFVQSVFIGEPETPIEHYAVYA